LGGSTPLKDSFGEGAAFPSPKWIKQKIPCLTKRVKQGTFSMHYAGLAHFMDGVEDVCFVRDAF